MTEISDERLAERVETKLRERAGFMRDAGHIDDAEIDEDAANLIQSLRAQGGVRVKALEWGALRYTDDYSFASDAATPIGTYIATDTGWFLQGRTGWIDASNMDAAKAAAQADYERRILASLEASPAPVSEEMVVSIATLFGNYIPGHGWTGFGPTPEQIEAALAAKGGQ